MKVLAIDPGPKESAFVVWDGREILDKGKIGNYEMLGYLKNPPSDVCIIEQIKSYGMAVSDSIFDTVFWSGRFIQIWSDSCSKFFDRIPRMTVKMHLCGQARAKDSNIRQALIDRFEPALPPGKKPCGVLKGLSKDTWAAFGLAVTWFDQNTKEIHGKGKD